MIRKFKQRANQQRRQQLGILAMSQSNTPYQLNSDLVCHSSQMDVCKLKCYVDDDHAQIYSAVALRGVWYPETVLISELRPATAKERKSGMRDLT